MALFLATKIQKVFHLKNKIKIQLQVTYFFIGKTMYFIFIGYLWLIKWLFSLLNVKNNDKCPSALLKAQSIVFQPLILSYQQSKNSDVQYPTQKSIKQKINKKKSLVFCLHKWVQCWVRYGRQTHILLFLQYTSNLIVFSVCLSTLHSKQYNVKVCWQWTVRYDKYDKASLASQ